jgi:inorganic triphosphatase YgiF
MDEVEGKLVLTSPDRARIIEDIASLESIGGYRVLQRSDHALADAYYDTPDRDLAGARLAQRVRSEDGRERLTLKGESRVHAGVITRHELEREWSRDALDEVLVAIRSDGVEFDTSPLDADHGAAAALASLGLLPTSPRLNQRTVLELSGALGVVVAELDLDRVTFTAGAFAVRHYELECEAHGEHGHDAINAVVADLRYRFQGLQPIIYSKLDLAEHLEDLAATGRLEALLEGDSLTAAAYSDIEGDLNWGSGS